MTTIRLTRKRSPESNVTSSGPTDGTRCVHRHSVRPWTQSFHASPRTGFTAVRYQRASGVLDNPDVFRPMPTTMR